MSYHKLLEKQIKKYLNGLGNSAEVQNFLNAINDSYNSFDRDRELMTHAFSESEKEYRDVNSSLKQEIYNRNESVKKLKEALTEISGTTISDLNGEQDSLIGISEYIKGEVIKRKNAETGLNETLQLLKTLLTNINSGILVEDENRKILYTNSLFCKTFSINADPEALIGMDCSQSAENSSHLFKQPISFVSEINKLLHFKTPVYSQILETTDDAFLERDYIPIFIDGVYKGNLWKYNDITSKIKIQQSLKESEENYRNIIDHATDIIYKSNNRGYFSFVNPVAERTTGYTKAELYNMHFSHLIRDDFKMKAVKFYINQVKKRISSTYFEFPIMSKTGKEIWIGQSVQFSMRSPEDFELTALAIDITNQKKNEEEIQSSNRQLSLLQSLIDNSSDAIQVATEDGVLFYMNKESSDRLGIKFEDAQKYHVWDYEEVFNGIEDWLVHVEEVKRKKVLMIESTSVNQTTGRHFPVEVTVRYIQIEGTGYLIANSRDITARKLIENVIRKQEEKYRNIIANMNLGLIEVTTNEEILYANQGFCNLSGYALDELVGKKATELFVSGDNYDFVRNKQKLRSSGVSDMYQIPIKNKNGELRWWIISGAPNYNDKGEFIGSIGIHLDITDQKNLESELEKSKVKAEEASKAKEIFLANMSHEIRTPLNAIIGMIRELSKEDLSQEQKNYVTNSLIASKHLLSIINNILDISKIEAGELILDSEHFILDQSINNVLTILSTKSEEKNIYLKSEFSSGIHPAFIGDPHRLEQIVMNLVGNSIKFTNKGGILVKCSLLEDLYHEQTIQISVTDTGVGMENHYLKTIFNKFSQEDKSVTRRYGGTGLGLAITHELVNLMGGDISVESAKNKGTTFYVTIRLKKGSVSSVKPDFALEETVDLNNKRILLVEDNELNRLVAQNTFKHYDLTVTEALNGLDAVEKLKTNKFDVILMDIQMPEMNGIDATRVIRDELKLDTPIIALTANAFKNDIDNYKRAGMNDYVTKPFDESILIKVISKYINGIPEPHLINPDNSVVQKTKSLYNLSLLKGMSRGDNEFVKKMVELFITQTENSIQQFKAACDYKDLNTLYQLAHKLKPSIDNMGIDILKVPVRDIERLSKDQKSLDLITPKVDFLTTTLFDVITELKEEKL